MESSGADRGFFQQPPVLLNQFHDDRTYQRCFKLFLSPSVAAAVESEVIALADEVLSDQVFQWISDAERNKPFVKGSGRDAFGRSKGELVTSEGWRKLQELGLANGMVACGYDSPYGPFSRTLQFLRLHLWEPSCANVTCPSAMQDGAARLLQLHISTPRLRSKLSSEQLRVFERAFERLTSRDPRIAWTSGQWMTERTGGSDVSLTETTAVYKPDGARGLASRADNIALGPWSVNGFKWFSSATDCNMTVLLARTPAGALSTFLAPLRMHDPEAITIRGTPSSDGERFNGVRIQRLKNKLGTQPLPTAELVLEDMRAWMIGEEGRGIQEIGTVLNLTRVHSAIAAMGYVGRGLAIARAYARVREVGAGKGSRMRLVDSPLHMKTLADMTAEYRGLMLLTVFTSYVLGLSEHPTAETGQSHSALAALTPEARHCQPLLRVLTQLTKAYVCKPAVSLLFSCMESLGGVGYLLNEEHESLNVARLYRDCAVLPIWEGTTDVLSTDFVRALKHPKGGRESLDALEALVTAMSRAKLKAVPPDGWDCLRSWKAVKGRIVDNSQEALMGEARSLVWAVADILVAGLLYIDAGSDGDPTAMEILQQFLENKGEVAKRGFKSPAEELDKNRAVVYGEAHTGVAASKL